MSCLWLLSRSPGFVRRGSLNGSPFTVHRSQLAVDATDGERSPVSFQLGRDILTRRERSRAPGLPLRLEPRGCPGEFSARNRGTHRNVNGKPGTVNGDGEPFNNEFLLNGPFYCVNHGV
jgi:hypothetical protein